MADHRQQHYESGLEVAAPGQWSRNDISLPEVAPYNHVDAKTASTPQVDDDPMAWHRYYNKNAGLEVAPSPSVAPGGYSQDPNAAYQHPEGYHHPSPTSPEPKSADKGKLCGMRRKVCYIIMAVAIVFVVAAIAIGVGAGVALGRQSHKSDSTSEFVSVLFFFFFLAPFFFSLPFLSSRVYRTNTRSPSDSTNLESTKTANITCPASDNTTYSAQTAPERHFRLDCGIDYNSGNGAVELSSESTTTMGACIDLCASKTNCVGAGWGNYYGEYVCWMKTKLGKSHGSATWYFAVDVNQTNVS
ncbi:hypothetical protein EsH8_IV_000541 [Colletotrichum jinshuiense]